MHHFLTCPYKINKLRTGNLRKKVLVSFGNCGVMEQGEREGAMKRRSILSLAVIISFCLIGCGNSVNTNDKSSDAPFDFYGVKIGDSVSDVSELCGAPNDKKDSAYIAYDNLEPLYDCSSQRIAFSLNDSNNVWGMLGQWQVGNEDEARKIYDTVKEKCINKYGDSYDDTHGDEITDRCVWETPEYRVHVLLQVDDPINNNETYVTAEYMDYNEMME